MKSIIGVYITFSLLLLFSCKGNKAIKWWVSTENSKWEEQRNILWNDNINDTSWIDIKIFPDSLLQEINGFGGCVNEKGWHALACLPEKKRSEIIQMLFSEEGDLHFNMCRLPIGASDYALDYYSLNDSAGDLAMDNFSLERDQRFLIPYIHAIQEVNENVSFWGSPWTPPFWMKKNQHYACASNDFNKLNASLQGKEGENQLIESDSILKAYALYFAKYVKEYKAQGIEISAVHVQNEFNSCQVFPSCTWNPELLSVFIGKYLGPRFKKSKINTEIWLGTIERANVHLIDSVLLKNDASQYIKGLGFQWAGKGAIAEVHKKYPGLPLMQTETECGNGSNDWAAAEYTFGLMKHYFDAGANAYMAWNMVLDTSGASTWGWKQNALISIDTVNLKYRLNPEFWLFKHVSYLLKSGAHLVKISSAQIPALAFLNQENNVVLVVFNPSDKKELKRVFVQGHTFDIGLMPHSFNTLNFKITN